MEPTKLVNVSATAWTAGARYATTWVTIPSIAFPASVNASFIASTSWPWAVVSASPNRSACSTAWAMPSAPPEKSGSSWAPSSPNIATAAADRSASDGRAEIAWAIAWNRSALDMPPSSSRDRPRFPNPAAAVAEPFVALTKATSAFVAAIAIFSIPTPARSPARDRPANSPYVMPSRAASFDCWSITSAWAWPMEIRERT